MSKENTNKKVKQTLAILLSIIMLLVSFSSIPVYANEQTGEIKMEKTIQKSLSETETRIKRISSGPIISVSTYEELTSALEAKTPNIYILQDIYLEDALLIDYDVSFLTDNIAKTLFSASEKRHIQITTSDVQIQFNNVILDGQYDTGIKGGGIEATDVTNISLISPTIQNCYNRNNGVALNNSLENIEGYLYIYNGIIRNNTTTTSTILNIRSTDIILFNTLIEGSSTTLRASGWGTICIGANEDIVTNLSIYDSIIRNNSSADGGAINIWNTNLVLNKNTVIENNTAKKCGGGIYAENSTIENYSTINHNTATQSGGGIYAMDSTIKNYSTINHNNASRYGGGIMLDNSTLVLENGEISYNTSSNNGGGISITNNADDLENVIINDGILQGNISKEGSAIGYDYLSNYDTPNQPKIIINGGTLSNNGYSINDDGSLSIVCREGGAIYGSYVEIHGGTIEKNTCETFGGGILAQNLIMTGGMVQDNGFYEDDDGNITVNVFRGGGIYFYQNADITGGLIYSNQAQDGGGVAAYGTLNLSSPAYIRYNTATNVGGGVYFYWDTSIGEVDYTRIKNNSAKNGSQYYLK